MKTEKKDRQAVLDLPTARTLTRPLKRAVVEVPDEAWQTYRDDPEVDIDCAPLEYYPGAPRADDYREPLRYLAIRVKKKQAELFADGSGRSTLQGDEYMGLAAAAAAGVASGEAGIDRAAARLCSRTSWRRA